MGLSKHFVKPKIILIILIPIRTNLILREWEIKGSGRRESFDASQLGFCFSKTLVVFSTETQILVRNLAKKVIGNGAEGKMGSGKCGAKIFKTFVYEQSSRWAFSDPKKQHKKSKLSKLKKNAQNFTRQSFRRVMDSIIFFILSELNTGEQLSQNIVQERNSEQKIEGLIKHWAFVERLCTISIGWMD